VRASEAEAWVGRGAVVVEWSDAEGWDDADGIDVSTMPDESPIVTVGKVVRVTSRAVFVSSEWLADPSLKAPHRHVVQIPVNWVTSIQPGLPEEPPV
jgi:hypothetical protein